MVKRCQISPSFAQATRTANWRVFKSREGGQKKRNNLMPCFLDKKPAKRCYFLLCRAKKEGLGPNGRQKKSTRNWKNGIVFFTFSYISM